jgi:hypothetical protein
MTGDKEVVIRELMNIPGMTYIAAESLWMYGVSSVEELKDKNPILLYEEMSKRKDIPPDQCTMLLNALRIGSHFASMQDVENEAVMKELKKVPGMTDYAAMGLAQIGIRKVKELKGKDPMKLYEDVFSHAEVPPLQSGLILSSIKLAVDYANQVY